MITRLTRLCRCRLAPLTLDRLLATVLTVLAQQEIWLGSDVPARLRLSSAVVAPVLTGSLAVRRRYPALVGTLVPVAGAIQIALDVSPHILAAPVTSLSALYALAVWTPTRRFVSGLAVVVTVDLLSSAGSHSRLQDVVFFTVTELVVVLLVRRVVTDRDHRADLAERERDVLTREAVVEERARIARELHDEIAHNVSMIVLQAGAERLSLGAASGSTREVLETIEQTGRRSLTEMRRLVGMLRSEGPHALAPQPRLDDLQTLVTQVREAGLPVELTVTGERHDLPVGVELSAYRIAQESLTNALKHAGRAQARIRIHYGRDSLELEIFDDGTGGDPAAANAGHGLVGMRERVALYGGRFDAGQGPDGGFAVRVLLPIR